MKFSTKSDLGRKRQTNQDCCAVKSLRSDIFLYAVCDGMGGTAGGEIASSTAIASFFDFIESRLKNVTEKEIPEKKMIALISNAIRSANTAVYKAASANPSLSGMGTTLVAALVANNDVYCANVGDSRMYYINRHGILQCSHDHSYVQYLVDLGKLTAEEARRSAKRNIITRAVGTAESVASDVVLTDVKKSDGGYILLCSDGLTNHVSDSEIYKIVMAPGISLEAKTNTLTATANSNGGSDNITVVLVSLQEKG